MEIDNNNIASPSPSGNECCRVCREPIKSGAAKCIHCGSYQDWTRYLIRWSTILVLLLGIAPLWSIASTLKTVFSKTANIEAALTSYETDKITIAFTNSGKLDGIVTEIDFKILLNDKIKKTSYKVRPANIVVSPNKPPVLVKYSADIVVSPNNPPVLVTYKAYIGNTPTEFISKDHGYTTCDYVMKIKWVDFRHNIKELSLKCTCPQ